MPTHDEATPVAPVSEPHPHASVTFQALGSDLRLRILRELAIGDRGVAELTEALDAAAPTLRYHLGVLLQDGIVEKVPVRREGRIGRPRVQYRLRKNQVIEGFPVRRYETLSEILLSVVTASLPPDRWERALYEAGHLSGRQLIAAIEKGPDGAGWNPQRFVRDCLGGHFAAMGLQTEVIDLQRDRVRYRAFTCPFQELAVKFPDRVCDHLDVGFHEGVADALGSGVTTRRLACMGHGAPYCEYSLQWTKGCKR